MRPLIEFGLRKSVTLNIAFLGLVLYGIFVAIPRMPIDRYPNFSFGEVQVITQYPGANQRDVERLVTRPIEDSIRGMKNIDWVSSSSVFGQSEVLVKFVDDTNYDALYEELKLRILGSQNRLPNIDGDPLQPNFSEIDVDEWLPVIQVNLVAVNAPDQMDKRALTLLGRELRDRLERLPGVKRVDIHGDERQQFLLSLDSVKLAEHRVSYEQIVTAIRKSGRALPAGTLSTPHGERTLRVDSRYRKRSDILHVIVRTDGDGSFVRVSDLIDPLTTGVRRIESSVINSVSGFDAVSCKVLKSDSGNSLAIRDLVLAEADAFREIHVKKAFDIHYSLDSSVKINDSLAVLYDSFMLALSLVVAVLFFFLTHHHRLIKLTVFLLCALASLVIATSTHVGLELAALGLLVAVVFVCCRSAVLTVSGVVFSFLGTLVLFYLAGQSLNEISLLGFVLVCGIIVDDAIIVLENIQRHREHGKTLFQAVVLGPSEVFWPVFSATLTTCAAFLPMLLMTGSTGDFFAILPISVSTALVISLVECFFLLPIHAKELELVLGPERGRLEAEGDSIEAMVNRPGLVGVIARIYDRILCWNLRHPFLSLAVIAGLFFCAIAVVMQSASSQSPILTIRFFPEDTSVLNVTIRMPNGTSLAETDSVVRQVSRELLAKGEDKIATCSAIAGMTVDSAYLPVWNRQYGFLLAELPPRRQRSYDNAPNFIEQLRVEFSERYRPLGISVEVSAQKDGPPTGGPISIRVSGAEDAEVKRLAVDLFDFLKEQSQPGEALFGAINLKHDREWLEEQISFVPKLEAMALSQVEVDRVSEFLAGSFEGLYVGDYLRLDDEIPIRLRFQRKELLNPADILGLRLADTEDGRVVYFADVGELQSEVIPSSLRRRNFQRTISISGDLAAKSSLGAHFINNKVSQWYNEHRHRYEGVTIYFDGEAEHTAKSYFSLGVAFVLAVFLIYLILATQFNSYAQPLIILSNVIFSFTGVVLVMSGLSLAASVFPEGWIREERSMLTVSSFIAMVGLTGIVVNDAIVLMDFTNKRVAAGYTFEQAVRLAGHQRMRPILMTTISTIAGLIPMAIGIPHFSISWSPFATCFVAGLLLSTVMTLLIIPVLYLLLGKLARR